MRCEWAGSSDLMIAYHDQEWGVPCFDDRKLFEMLILEGAQAGLSWSTILNKREGYRRAFANWDPQLVAGYDEAKMQELLLDASIVRNRAKIAATVQNAQAFVQVQKEAGSFAAFIWTFVSGAPKVNQWRNLQEMPAKTAESDAMSKALAKRGFKFVGSTICYAFMQATGMVNDHVVSCPRHRELTA
jgi:DNA-3-methyladenine glycosylase I